MDNTVLVVVASILLIIMMFVIIWFIISLIMLYNLQKKYNSRMLELALLEKNNNTKVVDYSNQLLEFIRMMISQVSILKLKVFIDNNHVDKITKFQVEQVVTDIATTVKTALNVNNIAIENTIYTQEFFEQYIIDTTVHTVKQLMEKTINDSDSDNNE